VALNGMAIEAFAAAGRIFKRPSYVATARNAAERIWALAYDPKKRHLRHEIFRARAQTDGFLDDYALLGSGFLALAKATGDKTWRDRAARLADDALRLFARSDGSLATSVAEKELVIPPQDSGDTAYPSGTSAAVARLGEAGLPFISVLTDPTFGGVTASFATLGDIILAEPKSRIGFAGPTVIEQTIKQQLPAGFQRAEFLQEHGMIDMIVPRKEMHATLGKVLDFFAE
jgi:hypothetical protein